MTCAKGSQLLERSISCCRCSKPQAVLLLALVAIAITGLILRPQYAQNALEFKVKQRPVPKAPCCHSGDDDAAAAGRAPPALRNFTVVTAYFTIGSLQKGAETSTRGPGVYFNWMWPYRFMLNAVVAFFDDESFAASFAALRKGLPTKIIILNRSDLWTFSLENRTRIVFLQPDYPKNQPKSTNAAYACAMHAKYELVAQVAKDNPFGSQYFAWMDIGIFRTLPSTAEGEFFTLRVPRCYREESVMFARIFPMVAGYTVKSVLRDGNDWVGGGFVMANGDVMQRFYEDYRNHVASYLELALANHDQSVILAMYLPEAAPRPIVPLQAVVPQGNDNPWFYLALTVRRDGLAVTNAGAASATSQACTYELHD